MARSPLTRAIPPVVVLVAGAAASMALAPERTLELERPLAEFPGRLAGFERVGEEELSRGELRQLHPDDYLLRSYRGEDGLSLDLFVAFYGRQGSGSSPHSPRNCLPGSGWQPVRHDRVAAAVRDGRVPVNRYVVQHESGARALVYYWYQGRGRVAASEYIVKLDLLRDAVFRRRTDEALVRLVFPVAGGEEELSRVDATAARAVREVIELLSGHLPA